MLQTILLSALSAQLTFVKPSQPANASTPQVVFTQVLPEEDYVSHTVAKNETLESIAASYYGSSDYWTTLWNNNTWISDPTNLEQGRLIKIPVNKPTQPEMLSDQQTQTTQVALPTTLPTIAAEATIQDPTITPLPTVAVTSTPTPTIAVQTPSLISTVPSSISDAAITSLGSCEAGMDPTKNTGNGYYGAFQFSYGTWKSMNTGYERADLAPIDVQIAAVKQLLQRSSIYNQFPGCARKMHAQGMI
ncbi:MAG TPA: LysM peptidoglycan-binding domain-containing protein [Candidatus Saccharimonadales bacterium]|nr:LysM peptidoglycan-binding domain-containing protein [Candidatus Saccharimonadales bacterium]